ncbi:MULTISPECIES: caspase family protein [Cyanophyceae]|uniref:caspase family protein n=1 Tax=Cyanophyceae TaxID=3028117 RepID=UPI0018EF84EB|nr:caspase family protein [Trichocoleus sp. FACHB-40]
MGLKRRSFLQRAGMALLALGVSETALSLLLGDQSLAVPLLDRYYQALAQPNGRKLALLVGINQYPHTTETKVASLFGCVTDVELQRELLIHRFGFHPSDILTLTDAQATRGNIETAFLEHLTAQASSGDVVLFHFSGYGSRVGRMKDEDDSLIQNPKSRIQNSLVPVDGVLSTKGTVGNDLLEETLFLLLRSLATDQVTTVLDTSYSDGDTVLQGNLRIRTCPETVLAQQASDEELAFQEELRSRLKFSPEALNKLLSGEMPGIVLAAAGPNQPATEARWGGFSAGLFTYALTQHLWQATSPTTVQVSFNRAAGVVEQLVGKEQQPQLMGQKSNEQYALAYNLTPEIGIGADGVITAVEEGGKFLHLWLAGLPAPIWEYYGVNSLFVVNSNQLSTANKEQPVQVQIRFKEGLTAKARVVSGSETSNLQVGQLVQESIRVLPRNIGLTVALDAKLERIERVDATSAFANVSSVSSVVTAGEQPADYLFGKVETTDSAGSYALFSPGRDLIFNTAGEPTEAVKIAVNRLTPKLKTLLAAKLWRLTANEGSSRLPIAATLEMVSPTEQVLLQRETLRRTQETNLDSINTQNSKLSALAGIPTLPIGSRVQYRIQNYSDRPIYFILLGIDSSGSGIAYYPPSSTPESLESNPTAAATAALQDVFIPAGATLTVPQPQSLEWAIAGPAGLAEIHLFASRAPFTQTLAAMSSGRRSQREGVSELFNPLVVARALLQDLHQASALLKQNAIASVSGENIGISSDSYALDVNAWATLSFVYQVG